MLIAEELKYVGTLCVEFLLTEMIISMLMRLHLEYITQEHLTINAFNVSQFENHVRAVCGLEQIPLKKYLMLK